MNLDPGAYPLDKYWVRRSFDRASRTYDAAAVLQTEVRDILLQRLDLTALSPRVVLDAGAGTGHAGRALKRRYPGAHVLVLDSSIGMLHQAAKQQSWLRPFARLCGDAEQLPLPAGSVDLIISNFMLQWSDPDAVFAEFRRVLGPQGLLSFTTLGPDTLRELRAAWAGSGRGGPGLEPRVMQFIDMHDLGDALVRAGFAAPVLDVERYTLMYPDVRSLAADLKAAGARNAITGRPKGLTSPRQFAAMQLAYEAFRIDGRLPATHEVVFGQAWAPAAAPRAGGGAAQVSLEEFKRQLKARRGSRSE
jgi:malonyl-CoA O-methyltransferase